jgi:hypothetical protein
MSEALTARTSLINKYSMRQYSYDNFCRTNAHNIRVATY